MRRERHNGRTLGVTSRFLMLLSASLLILCYFATVVNPTKAWFLSLFGLFFVPVAVLNLILLLWSAHKMSKAFLIPMLALLPSLIFIGRYYQFSSGAEEKASACTKILTYNVGHFTLGRSPELKSEDGTKACIDSIISFINSTDADIVCLQEVNLPGKTDVTSFLKKEFPGYSSAYYLLAGNEDRYGNVTLSRFPIVGKGRFDFSHSSNQAIYTDLMINGSIIRVYNCHFESYNVSIPRIAKSLGRDKTIVKKTEEKMKKSIKRRPEQVDLVMSDIEKCPVEAVVAGDFNDNPMSYTYFRLMKGRKDTFVEAGKGPGATYSAIWPFIRIDYILYPKNFGAVSSKVRRLKWSDHYPVVAEINFE